MARRIITIDEKIERMEAVVKEAKGKYEAALDELEKLVAQRKQLEEKQILEAYRKSKKTADEIIAFLNGEVE